MKIAVEGCAHGQLEAIYEAIKVREEQNSIKVDLLICCGDFQSTRNLADLGCMAIPPKFLDICSFYKYYSGEKVAPIKTIFIGGNHEASNYLQELGYGGWVAPNIYYLGYAGVINVNGIRIGGISGIFKGYDYKKGHYEYPPYSKDTLRSVYHVRSLEVFRLKQLTPKIDIMISHDWPNRITDYGNAKQLIRFKPYFKDEIEQERLGNPPCEDLLHFLKPKHWFSGHLHCRFDATVNHSATEKTQFLALDKCLPNRKFLEILDIQANSDCENAEEIVFSYDLEWLTILHLTNNMLNVKNNYTKLPQEGSTASDERTNFTPTKEEMDAILKKFNNDLRIPNNFVKSAAPFDPQTDFRYMKKCQNMEIAAEVNPQTTEFCEKLGIDDPLFLALSYAGKDMSQLSINASYVESEPNSTLNESSFNVSASDYDPDVSHTTRASLSMSLPKPKWTNDEEIDIESDDAETDIKNQTNSDTQPDDSLKRDFNSTLESSTDVTNTTVVEQETPAETPGKKFKRRNQTIYAETDE